MLWGGVCLLRYSDQARCPCPPMLVLLCVCDARCLPLIPSPPLFFPPRRPLLPPSLPPFARQTPACSCLTVTKEERGRGRNVWMSLYLYPPRSSMLVATWKRVCVCVSVRDLLPTVVSSGKKVGLASNPVNCFDSDRRFCSLVRGRWEGRRSGLKKTRLASLFIIRMPHCLAQLSSSGHPPKKE